MRYGRPHVSLKALEPAGGRRRARFRAAAQDRV